jgi:TPR repeat protein
MCLQYGNGVKPDLAAAVRYYKMSADLNNPDGMYSYATCLATGQGAAQDIVSAAGHFREAADLAASDTMNRYGLSLKYGQGVEHEISAPGGPYLMSTDRGNSIGMSEHVHLMYGGDGANSDFDSRVRFFRISADLGHSTAMYNYGVCLEEGRGVERDLALAARYYRMAADLGDSAAMYRLGVYLASQWDRVGAAEYLRMAAESEDPVDVWLSATRLMDSDGDAARRALSRLERSADVTGLYRLALMLRHGWNVRADIAESLRWYRRCAELGSVASLEHLGVCYEKGIGVDADLSEAVRCYDRASQLGSRTSLLSLGIFHWWGVGGFSVDHGEALRLWRLGGLEIPESALPTAPAQQASAAPLSDADGRSFRFVSQREERDERAPLSDADGRSFRFVSQREEREERDEREMGPRPDDGLFLNDEGRITRGGSAAEAHESFVLSHSDHVIESVVLPDGRSVRDYLSGAPPVAEIGRLAGEGIRLEGLRCLDGGAEAEQGQRLCEQMMEADTHQKLLAISAHFYTLNTFLYRRVNQFLRAGTESDPETGRNLGLYIGLLRECFCVCGTLSPLPYGLPKVVYRGADFALDVLADYARRPKELIRWQGFTSSSRSLRVALSFPGNVLFEISLTHEVASLGNISAFKNERESMLSPYQWFSLNCIRWDGRCGRWILSVGEKQGVPKVSTWFPGVEVASESESSGASSSSSSSVSSDSSISSLDSEGSDDIGGPHEVPDPPDSSDYSE